MYSVTQIGARRYSVSQVDVEIVTTDKALGTTEQSGIGSDSYIAKKILDEDVWTEPASQAFPAPALPINNKYLALGWADWFMEDQTVITPLLAKYGFQHTFYWQPKPKTDAYLTSKYSDNGRDPKKAEDIGSYMAEHCYLHWTYGQLCPLYDGRNTPTNDELRVDRGDGSNEWGWPITETVVDSLTYTQCFYYLRIDSVLYNKQWQNLTVSDCQEIRAAMSMFMVPTDYQNDQKLLEGLDYLSNYYLGTTGTSVYNDDYTTRLPGTADGLEPSSINPILGGVLTGATTTENHEFWERVLEISWRWKHEVHKITRKATFWTTSGGGSVNILYYTYGAARADDDNCFIDVGRNQIVDGEAKIHSAISGTTRSFNDVLRAAGYLNTMGVWGEGVRYPSSTGMGRLEAQRIYKKNQSQSRVDVIGDGFIQSLRIFDTKAVEAQINFIMAGTDVIKDCYDLTATNATWSGESALGSGKFDDFINTMSKSIAWGTIAEGVGDSGVSLAEDRASMAMFMEALFQYCKKAGVTIISHEQAHTLAFDEAFTPANYFPNPDFDTTPKTIIGSANAPDYPDGWNVGVVVEETVDGATEKCLHIDNTGGGAGTGLTRQYGVKPGNCSFTAWAEGKATLKIKLIRNIHGLSNVHGNNYEDWIEISIDNGSWTEINDIDNIPDAPVVVYDPPADPEELTTQYYFKGLDNKVCGIHIEVVVPSGSEFKLSKAEIDIGDHIIIPPESLGPELLVNGNFDAWDEPGTPDDKPTGFNLLASDADSYISNNSGRVYVTNADMGAVRMYQSILSAGKTYRITGNAATLTGTYIMFVSGSNTHKVEAAGDFSFDLAYDNAIFMISFIAAATGDILTNVSVKEIL